MDVKTENVENSKEEEEVVSNLKLKISLQPSINLYKALDFYVQGINKLFKLFIHYTIR